MENNLSDVGNQLLVMAAQEGDAQAMDRLARRWYRRLWRHVFRLTFDTHATWDITQHSWLAIIRDLRKLRDPARFGPWAYRIATNKSSDWLKKKSRDRYVNLDSAEAARRRDHGDLPVKELIQGLKDDSRVALSLYYFEHLSISEISIVLGIPQGTVKSRLFKARQELKRLLAKHLTE